MTTTIGWNGSLDERLENWGETLRWRRRAREAASFEGSYRSPQRSHWEHGSAPPAAPTWLNAADARVVNHAWQSMGDAFHQTLLAAWHVNRWSEPHCLRTAWEAAGEPARRRRSDFEASIAMARALIAAELERPAVARRTRIVARIRDLLGLVLLPDGLDNAEFAVAA